MLSATRLGKSLPLRRSSTGAVLGRNREIGVTGPSDNTHKSLLPCPDDIDTNKSHWTWDPDTKFDFEDK